MRLTFMWWFYFRKHKHAYILYINSSSWNVNWWVLLSLKAKHIEIIDIISADVYILAPPWEVPFECKEPSISWVCIYLNQIFRFVICVNSFVPLLFIVCSNQFLWLFNATILPKSWSKRPTNRIRSLEWHQEKAREARLDSRLLSKIPFMEYCWRHHLCTNIVQHSLLQYCIILIHLIISKILTMDLQWSPANVGYVLSVVSLTHWGRVTHICVSRLDITGSDNGLSPGRHQAIIWTNAGILLIGPSGTNFSENLIKILTFSFTKMRLKLSSAKWQPFCLGLNVLKSDLYPTSCVVCKIML